MSKSTHRHTVNQLVKMEARKSGRARWKQRVREMKNSIDPDEIYCPYRRTEMADRWNWD